MRHTIVRAAVVALLVGGTTLAYSFSNGPPSSKTNAWPMAGVSGESNCTTCHLPAGSQDTDPKGSVHILDVPAQYAPNKTYLLRVQLNYDWDPLPPDPVHWGFEITAVQVSNGQGVGQFTPLGTPGNHLQLKQGLEGTEWESRTYLEHTFDDIREGATGPVEWRFYWTAPPADVGTVYFFAAGNAANGDGSSSGDWIYTGSAASLPPARVSAVASVPFGSVIVGATAQQTLQVGNSTPSPGDGLVYGLTAPAGFIAPGGSFSVAAGAAANSHTLSMSTASSGTPAGNLVIDSNDPVTPSRNVALSGTVLDHCQPTLDSTAIATSSTVDLGSRAAGQFPDTTVRVHNLGFGATRARLNLSGAAITGGDGRFSIVGGFSPQLVGATPASIDVRFDDTGAAAGPYEATLTFTCADETLPGATAQPDLVVTLMAQVTGSPVAAPASSRTGLIVLALVLATAALAARYSPTPRRAA